MTAITPATLDVLLKVLGGHVTEKPTNEIRAEMSKVAHVVLKCMVRVIHVIHCSSPDQVYNSCTQLQVLKFTLHSLSIGCLPISNS